MQANHLSKNNKNYKTNNTYNAHKTNNHNKNNTNYNHVLIGLQDYMLTDKIVLNLSQRSTEQIVVPFKASNPEDKFKKQYINVPVTAPVPEPEPVIAPIVNNFFTPEQKDSLFWCYFIIRNGFAAYEYPGKTSYSSEKTMKFESIELLRTNKDKLKTNKIKKIKEDVEDELANKDKIGMKTFLALCIASGVNVLFIHKRKCFKLLENDEPVHVIHENPNKTYTYETNVSPEQLEYYKTQMFHWESVDKPLKAISNYKSDELVDLCNKLGLEQGLGELKKKTKKDLYELLVLNL